MAQPATAQRPIHPDRVHRVLEQERELVADDKLLMLAVQVVNGWRFEELMDVFAFTEPELIGYLVKLDRLGIIELLPRNRIRLRISRRFRWQKNGPIERSLARQVRENFLESRFDLSDESMGFVFGMLSARSTAIMQRRIEQLVREFNELHQEDLQLPRAQCEGRTMRRN